MSVLDAQERSRDGTERTSLGLGQVERALGLALLLVLTIGSVLVLRPFLSAIFLAVVLCVSTWPLFRALETHLAGRRTLAAMAMALMTVVILVLPLAVLGDNLADNIVRLSETLSGAIERGAPAPDWLGRVPFVGAEAQRIWIRASQEGVGIGTAVAPYVAPARDWALRQGATLLTGTLQLVLSIVLAFFLYRDGISAEKRLESAMARVGGWRAEHVLQVAGATISSVAVGVLGTALIQAILIGIGLRVAGVPGAFVLGALALVLSLVPLGLALIWLPAALWLLSQGHTGWAVFVLVWSGIFVGSLDNILRPLLIRRGLRMPTVLIFLGVLGGVITFGLLGVFLGPVLLAVTYTLIQDWEQVRAQER